MYPGTYLRMYFRTSVRKGVEVGVVGLVGFLEGGWGCGQLGDVPCRNTHVLGGSSHAGNLPPA